MGKTLQNSQYLTDLLNFLDELSMVWVRLSRVAGLRLYVEGALRVKIHGHTDCKSPSNRTD